MSVTYDEQKCLMDHIIHNSVVEKEGLIAFIFHTHTQFLPKLTQSE